MAPTGQGVVFVSDEFDYMTPYVYVSCTNIIMHAISSEEDIQLHHTDPQNNITFMMKRNGKEIATSGLAKKLFFSIRSYE
mmetsp:Transcript_9747/g.14655  ORF Transcript_9747/g.14655 Transcript_9747/m.14655 type:complete len:80 (-) Transcript_9747:219-458(-)